MKDLNLKYKQWILASLPIVVIPIVATTKQNTRFFRRTFLLLLKSGWH